jgi:uncharacterized protein YndB with AHSA1/START domain
MRLSAVVMGTLVSASAFAAVADSSSTGFTVKTSLTIQAPPSTVYKQLVQNVGNWWNPEHTFSNDSRNLSIEEKPMGCFCEKLPSGGGVRHMEVIYFDPGKTLRMSGLLGPLQSLGGGGTLTIGLSAAGNGTQFESTYTVAGYQPAGMNTWAAIVDGVLLEQFTRLKNYVERGAAASAKRP